MGSSMVPGSASQRCQDAVESAGRAGDGCPRGRVRRGRRRFQRYRLKARTFTETTAANASRSGAPAGRFSRPTA